MPTTILVENLHVRFEVFAHPGVSAVSALASRFRRRRRVVVEALSGVNFQVQAGEALGIIGHNGAGKSTLLKALTGAVPPADGRILVASQPQMLGAPTKGSLSGRANVELGLLGLGFQPEQIKEMAPGIIDFTQLGDFIDLPLRTYSSGMKQRLKFAISTARAPEILLLDEALAVGDRDFKDKSLARLNEIKERAGTIIIATHNMREVRRTCDRALWLRDGRALAYGDVEDVIGQYRGHATSERNTIRSRRQIDTGS